MFEVAEEAIVNSDLAAAGVEEISNRLGWFPTFIGEAVLGGVLVAGAYALSTKVKLAIERREREMGDRQKVPSETVVEVSEEDFSNVESDVSDKEIEE